MSSYFLQSNHAAVERRASDARPGAGILVLGVPVGQLGQRVVIDGYLERKKSRYCKRNARAQQHKTKLFRTHQKARLKNRPGRERITKHMRREIPSSETDSEFLTRSKQRMEIPSSLAVDMPLLLPRVTENQRKGKEGIKTVAGRWKQPERKADSFASHGQQSSRACLCPRGGRRRSSCTLLALNGHAKQ